MEWRGMNLTTFIHIIAYIGNALLFLSVFVNVVQHIRYQSKNSKTDKTDSPEILRINDYTFAIIIFGFVFIISSKLLILIYGI